MADQKFFTNDTNDLDLNLDALSANRLITFEDADVDFSKVVYIDSTAKEFSANQRYVTTAFTPNGTSIEITPASQPVLRDSTGLVGSVPINVTDTNADDDMVAFISGVQVGTPYVLSAGTNLIDTNGYLSALDTSTGVGWFVVIQRLGGSWYVMQATNY